MRIRDVMHAPAETCTSAATLEDVAHRMLVAEVGTVIVVGDDGTPVGLVTDRDLAIRGYARELGGDASVGEVMSHAIVTVDADADVFEAAATMAGRGVRRLPVIDDGKVAGVVALDDLTQLLAREAGELARAVAAQADSKHYAGWTSWDGG